MRLHRNPAKSGICFAWTPKQTSDGVVWLEHVHFKLVEGWGWGSDDSYVYERMVSTEAYDRGERAQSSFKAYAGLGHPDRYQTPPGDPKVFCNEYRDDGPTPCHYPFCAHYDDTGMPRCGREKRSCPQSFT